MTEGGPALSRVAVAFGHTARAHGLDAPVSAVVALAEAIGLLGLDRPEEFYWAGQAVFVRGPGERAAYGRAFAAFWSGASLMEQPPPAPVTVAIDDAPEDERAPDDAGAAPSNEVVVRYSSAELLRTRDFAQSTEAELAEAYRMMAAMRARAPVRRSRRRRPSAHGRGAPDLRRSVRRALRSAGEPVRLARTAPTERPRRTVLLVDVSGSMEPYARALLHFAHSSVMSRRRVEVFTIGTRLTRVTRELSSHDPDIALERAAGAIPDVASGTRLGAGLRAFNDRWGVAGLARGAVVVILSDGWDRGDPAELAAEMARLARVAYRIIWANPLKSAPGYEPLARGMAAALPFVDDFVEGHSIAALERLVEVMAG